MPKHTIVVPPELIRDEEKRKRIVALMEKAYGEGQVDLLRGLEEFTRLLPPGEVITQPQLATLLEDFKRSVKEINGLDPNCDHSAYRFEKHGRFCPTCQELMTGFGD